MPTFVDGPTVTLHAFAVAHPWLTPVVIGVTAAFIFLCPLWFIFMGVWERRLRPGVAALLGLGLTQWASHEVGKLVYQPRPFVVMNFTPLYPHPMNNSFPSTLTAFAAVAARHRGACVAAQGIGARVRHRGGSGRLRLRRSALRERCDRWRSARRCVRNGHVDGRRVAARDPGAQRGGASHSWATPFSRRRRDRPASSGSPRSRYSSELTRASS